jgi:hypothetical protein
MNRSPSCEGVRALAPELALGIATGEERARALGHLDSCPDCRRLVEDLARVADELVILAPPQEPPVGFESRVLDRLTAGQRARRWRRGLAVAASLAVGVTVGALSLHAATGDQREAAGLYRRALEEADGTYFGAVALRTPGGATAGHVFGYAGRTSWVFLVVDSAPTSGTLAVEANTRSGRRLTLGSLELTAGRGTFGTALPGELRDLAGLRVLDERGAVVLEARFPPGE